MASPYHTTYHTSPADCPHYYDGCHCEEARLQAKIDELRAACAAKDVIARELIDSFEGLANDCGRADGFEHDRRRTAQEVVDAANKIITDDGSKVMAVVEAARKVRSIAKWIEIQRDQTADAVTCAIDEMRKREARLDEALDALDRESKQTGKDG
jgi:hypothetical protein